MDDYKNLAFGRVLVPPSPPATGTSIELLLGQGQRCPTVPFNATLWPVDEYPEPVNAEIVRVTARSGDVLTIIRAQEGTVAQAIAAGYAFSASITKKMIDELRTASNINAGTLDNARLSSDVVLRSQIPEAWPIGSIFIHTQAVNPNALLGYGTWMAFGQGRVLVGIDASQTEFNTVEKIGGTKTHGLTVAEMPGHAHTGGTTAGTTVASATGGGTTGNDAPDHAHFVNDPTHAHNFPTNSVGGGTIGAEEGFTGGARATFAAATGITIGGATARHVHGIPALSIPALTVNPLGIFAEGGNQPHNNLQPYVTVYMWKRTA